MGMTMTEKILARAAGKESVTPGELIIAKLDFCFGNDVTAPVAIDEFEIIGNDCHSQCQGITGQPQETEILPYGTALTVAFTSPSPQIDDNPHIFHLRLGGAVIFWTG